MNQSDIPSEQTIQRTKESIEQRGVHVILVNSREEALIKIKELIPKGAEVMNGSSTTLNEIGFTDYLKSNTHGWKNLHESLFQEKDPAKQGDLRRSTTSAEYFLGSVNAISENGELVSCDASGSRVTAYPFAAKHLILVAGIQKIAPNLESAMKRVREYVLPLEDARAQAAYGMHSRIGKWVIIESEMFQGRTTLILVKEKLGF